MGHATEIVGYTYSADMYCPACIVAELVRRGEANPYHDTFQTEAALDSLAIDQDIDRYDEYTFNSDDFPKVVSRSQEDGYCTHCGRCGEPLTSDECECGEDDS
jgi:hypothetical protein